MRLNGKVALSYLDAKARVQHLKARVQLGLISLDWCHQQRQSGVSNVPFQLKLFGPDLGVQYWDCHHDRLGKQGSLPGIHCPLLNKNNPALSSRCRFCSTAREGHTQYDQILFSGISCANEHRHTSTSSGKSASLVPPQFFN